ncbi:MAG: hypothetical protein J6X35_01025 [Bacteroidales bacterium]|nr:hypothetical protein [Bacteroidales bacterium]
MLIKMKSATKIIITILLAVMCGLSYAQTNQPDYQLPPKPNELVIGVVSGEVSGGTIRQEYIREKDGVHMGASINERIFKTEEQLLEILMEKAEKKYKATYPKFLLRNFKSDTRSRHQFHTYGTTDPEYEYFTYIISATVVVPDPKALAEEKLSAAIDKALRNMREGDRVAIDQVTVPNGTDRENFKDQLIDILLDKGYKVVAKEYLEKLYAEQKNQQSGIYNENTTVQGNNFSAVGYYINVKVTETSLRVQVVNVSTGEYEGNATINF